MRKRRKHKKKRKGFVRVMIILLLITLLAGSLILKDGNTYSERKLIKMGYPDSLIALYLRNEEARDFVLNYDESKGVSDNIDVSDEIIQGEIPLFLQWDERWGYGQYGDDFMGVTGCGPTALSMVYCGLTGDATMNPWAVAKLAEEHGMYVYGAGSSWNMMSDLAAIMGLNVYSITFDRECLLQELWAGHPIICIMGPGDFTTTGHFIVLTGADSKGNVTVNDPNSHKNSKKEWDIDTLMGQIRSFWVYE